MNMMASEILKVAKDIVAVNIGQKFDKEWGSAPSYIGDKWFEEQIKAADALIKKVGGGGITVKVTADVNEGEGYMSRKVQAVDIFSKKPVQFSYFLGVGGSNSPQDDGIGIAKIELGRNASNRGSDYGWDLYRKGDVGVVYGDGTFVKEIGDRIVKIPKHVTDGYKALALVKKIFPKARLNGNNNGISWR